MLRSVFCQKNVINIVFFVSLGALLFISAYAGQLLLRKENQVQNHELLAEILAEKVQLAIDQRLQVIKNLARNSHVVDVIAGRSESDNPSVRLTLNSVNEATNSELILILDKQGTVISSTDNYSKSLTGQNYAFRPYFQRSLAGDSYIFPAVGAVTHTRGIYLSAPILIAGRSSPAAVIALKIGIEEIEAILRNSSEINALVSPDGIVFSSNRDGWLFHSVGAVDRASLERLYRTRQFGEETINRLAVSLDSATTSIDGERYRVIKSALPYSGWHIYSCQKATILAPLPNLHLAVLAVSVAIVGGMSILIFLLATNIFHRHKTELMLLKAEEKYFRIFKNATMGIFQSTLSGKYLEASPSMADILGYDGPAELCAAVGDSGRQVYARPEDRETFVRTLREEKTVKGFETLYLRKDGEKIWVNLSGRIVQNDPLLGTYIEGFCLDISENKKAHETLRHERNVFSKVMETVPVGIVLLDRDERITFANPMARDLLRLAGDGLDGQGGLFAWDYMDMDGQPLRQDRTPVSKAVRNGAVIQDERVRVRWKGEKDERILSFNIAPIFSTDRQVQELVVAFSDITATVVAEREASLQQEQLIHADRMISLGILTSGIAHEINNPNTFILSNAELLAEAWQVTGKILDLYYEDNGEFYLGGLPYSIFKNKAGPLCSRIVEGASRIKYIVQELREYSAHETGELSAHIDLNAVIQSAQILLSNMIRKSTYDFSMSLAAELPPVRGNFHRLEQVIINIIQNACQALPDPERRLAIETLHERDTGKVVFLCTDEGVGIPEQELGHVMDPFYTTKRDIGGIGLGLSISSNIISKHGGEILITSGPCGTTVRIELPVMKDGGAEPEPAAIKRA